MALPPTLASAQVLNQVIRYRLPGIVPIATQGARLTADIHDHARIRKRMENQVAL
jgi:hypothetical protein